jgi:hypothetical protein
LDEDKKIGGKLIVACRDPTTLLDPIEDRSTLLQAVEIRGLTHIIDALAFE